MSSTPFVHSLTISLLPSTRSRRSEATGSRQPHLLGVNAISSQEQQFLTGLAVEAQLKRARPGECTFRLITVLSGGPINWILAETSGHGCTYVCMYVCVCVHLPSRMVVGIAGCTGTEDRSTPLGSSQSCLPGYLPIDCDATDKTCPKTVTPRTIPTCRSKLPSLLAVAVWNWPGRLGRGVSKVARVRDRQLPTTSTSTLLPTIA